MNTSLLYNVVYTQYSPHAIVGGPYSLFYPLIRYRTPLPPPEPELRLLTRSLGPPATGHESFSRHLWDPLIFRPMVSPSIPLPSHIYEKALGLSANFDAYLCPDLSFPFVAADSLAPRRDG